MPKELTQLDTLSEDGRVPASRIADATQGKAIYDALFRADTYRAQKRAMVKGLVDGNPPYNQGKLKAAGRDYQCNVNWRIGESYFNAASGAFYDVSSEAPNLTEAKTKHGTPEQIEDWSKCIVEHFDWLLKYEPDLDYVTQISLDEMVLYGCGPQMFQDEYDWRTKSVLAGQLKVPERAKSNTSYWELACVEVEYVTGDLYEYIQHAKEASEVGWDVAKVKKCIIHANPESQKGGIYKNWEWHQQQLKNGSLYHSQTSRTIRTVHQFFKEFPKKGEAFGKITHQIILADSDSDKQDGFLFKKIGRYDNWNQCIHPMYYDRGGGGFHHSVTGMGVKMFSAIEYQNRLLCNLADKAFTPKIMFKPSTEGGAEEFGLQQFGEYAVIEAGFEAVQTPISGVMDEAMVFNREVTGLISSNLSQYRTNATEPVKGNPDTATQVKLDASKEASLQKTQLSRYYAQMDALRAEQFRRAANPSLTKEMCGGARAVEFRERCKKDGVPEKALQEMEYVKAARVIGQGSAFMRQQSLDFLFASVLMTLPEVGRDHLIEDVIASRAGYSAVNRYYPTSPDKQKPTDQHAFAMSQVADMKVGVPAVVTDTQNPVIFAQTFLKAGADAANSLQQGGDPQEVAQFLELIGQATAQHLQRLQGDKSRKGVFDVLAKQFKQLAAIHDELINQLEAQAKQQQSEQLQLQQRAQSQNGELELKTFKTRSELALKNQKQQVTLGLAAQKTRAGIIMADATTSAEIHRSNAKAKSESKED